MTAFSAHERAEPHRPPRVRPAVQRLVHPREPRPGERGGQLPRRVPVAGVHHQVDHVRRGATLRRRPDVLHALDVALTGHLDPRGQPAGLGRPGRVGVDDVLGPRGRPPGAHARLEGHDPLRPEHAAPPRAPRRPRRRCRSTRPRPPAGPPRWPGRGCGRGRRPRTCRGSPRGVPRGRPRARPPPRPARTPAPCRSRPAAARRARRRRRPARPRSAPRSGRRCGGAGCR